MNVANVLGLASEALPTPGAPPPVETAAGARPFTALLTDALDEGGETGTLPAPALLAGEPLTAAATAPLAIPAAPEKPLADAADPDADDRRTLSALAALPGPLFTTSPLPPPLADAPLGQTPAGPTAWPATSLSQAVPGVALGGETLPGGPPRGLAIKAAALDLASAGSAVAAAEVGPGQKLDEVPAAPAGLDKEPSPATSAQRALGPAAAVRPAPAPEAQRTEPAPLRHAATDARTVSALAGSRAGASAGLEAAEAMAPAPEAKALPIHDVPERALRIASELRADGAKHFRAELQLDPPGLGRVRIEIELSVQETGDAERSLTRITVESAAAHEQLQAELPRLRALLAEQGLGEAQVELHLRRDQGDGHGTEEQQAQRSLRQGGEADERERSGRRLEWRSTHDGLIDLRA